jgi:hypothetical protein
MGQGELFEGYRAGSGTGGGRIEILPVFSFSQMKYSRWFFVEGGERDDLPDKHHGRELL